MPRSAPRHRGCQRPQFPLIVLTATHDVEHGTRQVRADGTLGKPFDLDDLLVPITRPGR